ncbi:MAG: amino acid ABC transporter substrate-binding protein [Acidobacteriota bacterium]|nr:amino acid ABC transporter substrate-binding protein [Acidobacteriota bacterium]
MKGPAMRHLRSTLAALVSATALSAVTLGTGGAGASTPSLASCKTSIAAHEYAKGKLTVATDNPVYPPWFVNNKPANGKGYESAVVYAIAKVLGVSKSNVKWVTEPFDSSYTPGSKAFDFDINEISYTADRAKAVSFSTSYYDVQQSIVALKTDPIVAKHSPTQLRTYLYGDQVGTTGLAYINDHIKPTRPARVYSTLDQAVLALKTGQIDAIVIDTPTGQYMASAQILGTGNKVIATQVGQFPSVGEHYGLLFQKNSKLVGCVNAAISAIKANGTLAALTTKWLGIYTSVPNIKP